LPPSGWISSPLRTYPNSRSRHHKRNLQQHFGQKRNRSRFVERIYIEQSDVGLIYISSTFVKAEEGINSGRESAASTAIVAAFSTAESLILVEASIENTNILNLSAAEASSTKNILQVSAPTCQAFFQICLHLSQLLQPLRSRARCSPVPTVAVRIGTADKNYTSQLHRASQLQCHDRIPIAGTNVDDGYICANAILCYYDQFAAVPYAAMTDRVCDTTTTCTLLQFEFQVATATSNRIGSNVTDCAVDNSIAVPATANSNNFCMKLSVGISKDVEHTPPTATSNRICPHVPSDLRVAQFGPCLCIVDCMGHRFLPKSTLHLLYRYCLPAGY